MFGAPTKSLIRRRYKLWLYDSFEFKKICNHAINHVMCFFKLRNCRANPNPKLCCKAFGVIRTSKMKEKDFTQGDLYNMDVLLLKSFLKTIVLSYKIIK